jgi:calcineurin-like phosphoesterase family protein
MKVTDLTRRTLAVRREARQMERLGYRRHETDWEIHRGIHARLNDDTRIVDARVSADGLYVWTKLGKP